MKDGGQILENKNVCKLDLNLFMVDKLRVDSGIVFHCLGAVTLNVREPKCIEHKGTLKIIEVGLH